MQQILTWLVVGLFSLNTTSLGLADERMDLITTGQKLCANKEYAAAVTAFTHS